MLGVLSVIAGLAVGFWVVKRLFGRVKEEEPADVASFDFYVASAADDSAGSTAPSDSLQAQRVQ